MSSSSSKKERKRKQHGGIDVDRVGLLVDGQPLPCVVHGPRGYFGRMGPIIDDHRGVWLHNSSAVLVDCGKDSVSVRVIKLEDGTVLVIKKDKEDYFGDYIYPPNPCNCNHR